MLCKLALFSHISAADYFGEEPPKRDSCVEFLKLLVLEPVREFILARHEQDVAFREFVQDFSRIGRIRERLTYGIHDSSSVRVCDGSFAELGHSHRERSKVRGGMSSQRRLLQGDAVIR